MLARCLAVRDASQHTRLSRLFPELDVLQMNSMEILAGKRWDVILVCFDPWRDAEWRWIDGLKMRLNPGGDVELIS